MKTKKIKGFTLVELLISMSILSIIGLAFFSIINTAIKTNTKNEFDIKALHLAQSEIENLRAQIKKSSDNELYLEDLNNNKINIADENSYESDKYIVKINIEEKEYLLYEIRVVVQSSKQNFSKKKTELITQVIKSKG